MPWSWGFSLCLWRHFQSCLWHPLNKIRLHRIPQTEVPTACRAEKSYQKQLQQSVSSRKTFGWISFHDGRRTIPFHCLSDSYGVEKATLRVWIFGTKNAQLIRIGVSSFWNSHPHTHSVESMLSRSFGWVSTTFVRTSPSAAVSWDGLFVSCSFHRSCWGPHLHPSHQSQSPPPPLGHTPVQARPPLGPTWPDCVMGTTH